MRRFAILSLAFLPARLAVGVSADECPARGGAAHHVTRVGLLAVWAAFLSAAPGADSATAQTKYRFINIADSSGPLNRFGGDVSINNHGTVAFVAIEDNYSSRGVFVGNGGPISTIAHTSGPYSDFYALGGPDINDSGTVAFSARLDGGGGGVFTSDGVTTTTITLAGGGKLSINQTGAVAFWAARPGTSRAVFIGNGGEGTLAANPWTTLTPVGASISMGDDGYVSFSGRMPDGVFRILKANGGVPSTIVQSGAKVDVYSFSGTLSYIHAHATNSKGTTAFIGEVFGERGVFTVKDGVVTTVTHHFGSLRQTVQTFSVAINDAGTVAFIAGYTGIYTGDDPVADKVIRQGDALFGSTLLDLPNYIDNNFDINNRGDIAFRYRLANGVEGIAVAKVVPEPGNAALLSGAWVIVAVRYSGATGLRGRQVLSRSNPSPSPSLQGRGTNAHGAVSAAYVSGRRSR